MSNTEIADRCAVTRQTVVTWRHRYERSGLAGLDDVPKPGRPRRVDANRFSPTIACHHVADATRAISISDALDELVALVGERNFDLYENEGGTIRRV
jgi:Winged helix-turn helix